MKYNWVLPRLPLVGECGMKFNLTHVLLCQKGGLVSLRHNRIRNITASLQTEVTNKTSKTTEQEGTRLDLIYALEGSRK